LGDALYVGAVFITEGRVRQQILDGDQTLGFEHLGAGRSNAFDVLERGGSVQRGGFLRVQVPVYNGARKFRAELAEGAACAYF
jgi:hypothetical protein